MRFKKSLFLILSIVVLGLILFQAKYEIFLSNIKRERFLLLDAYQTPVLHFSPSAEHKNSLVAFLVHGHQCNKSMMGQLARYLALGGVEVFALDLPGHGESQKDFSLEESSLAVESGISEITNKFHINSKNIILIGHSFGATALSKMAARRDFLATIFIGPGKISGFNGEIPSNVLLITAEHDYEHIKHNAKTIYDELTKGVIPLRKNGIVGDFQQKNARLWKEISGLEHVSLLFDLRVYQTIRQWIESASGKIDALSSSSQYSMAPFVRAILAALGLSLILAGVMANILKNTIKSSTECLSNKWASPALAIVMGLFISAFLTKIWIPLHFLRLKEGEVLASFMAMSGIIGLSGLIFLEKKIIHRLMLMDLVVGVVIFLVIYFLVIFTVEGEFYSLSIAISDSRRLLNFGIVSIVVLPFFLMQEVFFKCLREKFSQRLLQFSITACFTIFFATVFCSSLYFTGMRLYRFIPAFVGVMAYCTLVNIILYEFLKQSYVGIFVSSCVAGWIISVGFFYY